MQEILCFVRYDMEAELDWDEPAGVTETVSLYANSGFLFSSGDRAGYGVWDGAIVSLFRG